MENFKKFSVLLLALLLSFGLMAGCGGDDDDDDDSTTTTTTPTSQLPSGVTCNGDTCTLSGTITEDFTLTSDKTWVLGGGVFIGDDVNKTVLTVQAGTTVYGETASKSMLVIRRNSQINAVGTKNNPIVFTSAKNPGSRARGDWGGLIINGKAPLNTGAEAEGEGGTGKYGGSNPNDNSGTLKYVRVEFAGKLISEDNELNGIAFQACGSGTTVDYVQVHMNADDGIEFFGGTCNFKHVITTGIGDDNLDWTDGWQGKGQFFVCQQYDDNGDQGIEADNNGENNDATPRSGPTISNLTLIGSPNSEKSDIGMLLREGTAAHISNAIVYQFNDAGLDIDHDATFNQVSSGDLTITNSIIYCAKNFKVEKDDMGNPVADPVDLETWFNDQDGNSTDDPQLDDALDTSNPDFRPASGSSAIGAGRVPSDSFFESVDYIGGVDPDNDWTDGWTTSAKN